MSTQQPLKPIMRSAEEEENSLEPSEKKEEDESERDGEDEDGNGSERTDEHADAEPLVAEGRMRDCVKKEAGVLNLNNEVVRMRKEVKRLRALCIRKLTRHIAALRKKKGKEADVERNQRRAARLLEEVHAMKNLTPDVVTKTALQTNLDFEAVCKNPKSTISDRATARIATHPQFQKKITEIKAAVKAFKIERMKGEKQAVREKGQQRNKKATPQTPEKKGGRTLEKKEESAAAATMKSQGGDEAFKGVELVPAAKGDGEESKEMCSKDVDAAKEAQDEPQLNISKPKMDKNLKADITTERQNQSKAVKKNPSHKPDPVDCRKSADDDDESGCESSDEEEKEYFDDSTEERFLKQSSQSEESEDDDFFLGKVSKYKKKKKKKVDVEVTEKAGESINKGTADDEKRRDKLQSELDELECRLKSKAKPLASEFCSSLRGNKSGPGRGRGADKFRGRGKPRSAVSNNRDFRKRPDEPKQEQGMESASKFSCNKTATESGEKGFASAGRGRGRGRGAPSLRHGPGGRGVFTKQVPQEALHPSWEASKKRKEQQGQILAFQGKKIKFDDD